MLEKALDNVSDLISIKEARITNGELPTIFGNASQLVQAFEHLISNGINFSERTKPRVHISAELFEEGYTFKVSDNGTGFEEGSMENAFNIFESIKNESSSNAHGIGLAIVKKVIENHKGKIWIESEKGKGSSRLITLEVSDGESSDTAEASHSHTSRKHSSHIYKLQEVII